MNSMKVQLKLRFLTLHTTTAAANITPAVVPALQTTGKLYSGVVVRIVLCPLCGCKSRAQYLAVQYLGCCRCPLFPVPPNTHDDHHVYVPAIVLLVFWVRKVLFRKNSTNQDCHLLSSCTAHGPHIIRVLQIPIFSSSRQNSVFTAAVWCMVLYEVGIINTINSS